MKGQRAVIPAALRQVYIAVLHKGHMGVERTRQLACDIAFWPKMRQDIESAVSQCSACDIAFWPKMRQDIESAVSQCSACDIAFWPKMRQDIDSAVSQCSACNSCRAHLQKQPLISHPVPELPWSTIAADIFDWEGRQYLVTVDSYSGWFEMDPLSDMSSRTVIGKLQRLFATHGIPEKLLTDNGRQFVSRDFKLFSQEWNFTHLTSSPYYPKSNGLAENAVKQVKQLLEKSKKDGSNVMLGLLNLRNTPRELMGSPAQRLMSRRTGTTLPTSTKLLKPKPLSTIHTQKRLQKARQRQKKYHDKTARDQRPLRPNEVVRLQTDKGFKKLAVVKSQRDTPRSYVVTSEGADYVRNRQHLVPVNEPRPQWNTADHSSQDLVQAPVAVPLPQTLLLPTPQTVLHAPVAASPPLSTPQKPCPSASGHPDPFPSPCLLLPSSVSAPSPSPPLVSSPASMPARNLVQDQRQPVVTRSGRVPNPKPRYFDT